MGKRTPRLRVVFLGFCQSDGGFRRLMTTESGMPTQTQRFGWSLVHALESANCNVSIVSAAPASDWPMNRRVVFRGAREVEAEGAPERQHSGIGFINILGAKHATRYLTARKALRKIVEPRLTDVILVHGVHSPFLHAAIRCGQEAKVPVCVVLTDAPTEPDNVHHLLNRATRRVDSHLIRSALHKADATVALTQALADDFVPGRPCIVMEGIARTLGGPPNPVTTPPGRESTGTNRVVYAGGLSEEYGVGNLLKAAAISEGTWRLDLYGRGPLETRIRDLARESDRIHWGGLVDEVVLSQVYRSADLLINPRRVDLKFVRYSFPSKLLEYLAAGRPVMTTRLPGIPTDYESGLLFTGDAPADISRSVDAFFRQPSDVRGSAATRAIALARTKGEDEQGERLAAFLERLTP